MLRNYCADSLILSVSVITSIVFFSLTVIHVESRRTERTNSNLHVHFHVINSRYPYLKYIRFIPLTGSGRETLWNQPIVAA
uniref:Uncharacterized protein n=1 Tax=Rhipicephalus microplus TaxID=6941 RepID=A0A6G5A0S6_RHIMP